jgi:hypothetical protein
VGKVFQKGGQAPYFPQLQEKEATKSAAAKKRDEEIAEKLATMPWLANLYCSHVDEVGMQ